MSVLAPQQVLQHPRDERKHSADESHDSDVLKVVGNFLFHDKHADFFGSALTWGKPVEEEARMTETAALELLFEVRDQLRGYLQGLAARNFSKGLVLQVCHLPGSRQDVLLAFQVRAVSLVLVAVCKKQSLISSIVSFTVDHFGCPFVRSKFYVGHACPLSLRCGGVSCGAGAGDTTHVTGDLAADFVVKVNDHTFHGLAKSARRLECLIAKVLESLLVGE